MGLSTLANGAHATIENSILWGKPATHPEVIGYWTEQLDDNWDADYSCIAHGFEPKEPGSDVPDPGDLPGCTDLDPLFLAPSSNPRPTSATERRRWSTWAPTKGSRIGRP